jgi:hypothetical protein
MLRHLVSTATDPDIRETSSSRFKFQFADFSILAYQETSLNTSLLYSCIPWMVQSYVF